MNNETLLEWLNELPDETIRRLGQNEALTRLVNIIQDDVGQSKSGRMNAGQLFALGVVVGLHLDEVLGGD